MDIWLIGGGGGVSLSCNWCSVVVFHGSMVNWRRGAGFSLLWKLFGVMVFQRSMLNWLGGSIGQSRLPCQIWTHLHFMLCFTELIFPIQQQNMTTSSEKLMLICICHLIIGGFIWALHLTSWPSWTLHLKTWPNSAVCDLLGHFIWKLDLILPSVHIILFGGYIWQLIWVLHLTSWPSCALHLKTWPNSVICFKWALTDNIDQWRLHLLSLAVSCWGYIWELIWVLHLKIWTHLPFYALLHRRSFHITYKRPNDNDDDRK